MSAPSPAIEALQQEINRYAEHPDIGFVPIACDGLLGPATMQGLLFALTIISLSSACPFAGSSCAADAASGQDLRIFDANAAIEAINKPGDILARADGLTDLLQEGARYLKLPRVACPSARPVGPSAPRPAAPRTPAAEAVRDKYKNKITGGILGLGLPDWVVYVGGGALAVGLGYLVLGRMRRAPAAPPRVVQAQRAPVPLAPRMARTLTPGSRTNMDQRTMVPE